MRERRPPRRSKNTQLKGAALFVYLGIAVLSYVALGVFYAYTSDIVSAIGPSTAHTIIVAVGCVVTVPLLMWVARRWD
jgi:hypothetical protein